MFLLFALGKNFSFPKPQHISWCCFTDLLLIASVLRVSSVDELVKFLTKKSVTHKAKRLLHFLKGFLCENKFRSETIDQNGDDTSY